MWMVFYSSSSNIDEVLLTNPLLMLLSLDNFSISNYLTQMVDFPTRIPDCDSHSPAILGLFLSSDTSIYSTMAFPPLGNSDHVIFSVAINFPSYSQWNALFHHIAYDYSCVDWDSLCDHLWDVPWENIFKLGASAAANEFCKSNQAKIDVYIPHQKYQVNPHSSPWFSAACDATIVHRNHFFHLYQKDKFSESKVNFRQASNCCKRVLEAAKLAYVNKTKDPITSQKCCSWDF